MSDAHGADHSAAVSSQSDEIEHDKEPSTEEKPLKKTVETTSSPPRSLAHDVNPDSAPKIGPAIADSVDENTNQQPRPSDSDETETRNELKKESIEEEDEDEIEEDENDEDDAHVDSTSAPVHEEEEANHKSTNERATRSKDATSTSTHRRKSGHRSSQTLLMNTKIKHLKKVDGEALWRKDIQYDFLSDVFNDTHAVFTNSATGKGNCTFADIYIDTMTRSSKSSKVLRDKLIEDRNAAVNTAKVCLLVNIGRMNTTLNFFPEMRAQLRTYHPIPSLQAYTDASDYKQLQDAPRLKNILKGACEDQPEPSTLSELASHQFGRRTNPVNMIFLLATYANTISEQFFEPPYEFCDLIMNTSLSSSSRARAFLWLLWSYLETDLSPEELKRNPFGYGQADGTKVPEFQKLTPDQEKLENVDQDAEREYAERMTAERKRNQQAVAAGSPTVFGVRASRLRNIAAASLASSNGGGAGSAEQSGATATTSTPVSRKRRRPGDANSSGSRNPYDLVRRARNGDEIHSDSEESMASLSMSGSPAVNRLNSRRPKKEKNEKDIMFTAEIEKLVKRRFRKLKRQRYMEGPFKRTWSRIHDRNPLQDSDEETSDKINHAWTTIKSIAGEHQPTSHARQEALRSLDTDNFDEEAVALDRALHKSKRWLDRYDSETTNGTTPTTSIDNRFIHNLLNPSEKSSSSL